jgi:subtilase family serine protease
MFLRLSVFTAFLFSSLTSAAQQAPQVLHKHVRSEVSNGRAAWVGSLPATQHMNLSIVLPLRNQAALINLLGRLYDPSSPDYRHFLSVSEFTDQFGPTVADYQAVLDFVHANGLSVTGKSENRLIVPVSGSVAQIERAFHVQMNLYQHPTENRAFYSPDREPSVDLSTPMAHIAGLNNYSIPRPTVTKPTSASVFATDAATGSGPGNSYLASDMRAAYYGGSTLTGSGQVVGLFEINAYNVSDVTASFAGTATATQSGNGYLLAYAPVKNGTTYDLQINNVYADYTSQGYSDDAEQVADIVQAIGMAPGLSQLRVYVSGGSDINIFNAMASENIAKQLSCSFSWIPDDRSVEDWIFQEFAAQGQSLFVASGDFGAFDPYQDYQSLYEDYFFPADDDWVTSVGGTDLTTNGAGGSWNSETAWPNSGGGISPNGTPIPIWQAGVANSSNGGSSALRNIPDVAAEAHNDNFNCDMGICEQTWGGTSFAAPRWAGFTALVNQQATAAGNPTVGFLNPEIYAIGGGPNSESNFHDITMGNNDCCSQPISYNAVPGYDLVTGWGSPAGQALIDALAPPTTAGFQLSTSPSVLSIAPGTSGTTTIKVQDIAGFTGNVNLTLTGLPSGVIASFSPSSTSETSLLSLSVGSSVARGSYLVNVIGTSGSVTTTATVAFQVNAPGFSIASSPAQPAIYAGSSGSTTVNVADYAGFAGEVNLAVTSGLPSGVTASWVSNPTATGSLLVLTADSSAAPRISVVTITGTSGALTSTTNIELQVSAPAYILDISPVPTSIVQGSSVTATVTLVSEGNVTGPVTLSAPTLPAGVTAQFGTNPFTETSILTMTASASAPLGTSSTHIDGTAANYLPFVNDFQQTVMTAPTPNYSIGVSPASLTLIQGSSVTDAVTLTASGGVSSVVALSVGSQLPSGVTASFSPGNVVNGTSVLTLSASSSAAPGIYALSILGSPTTLATPAVLYLTVKPPPSFALGTSPNSLTVAQGASNQSTITVTPQIGFTGAVTLSAPALPSGLTASFTPNPATGNSMVSFAASNTTPAGNYTVIVNGTSGSQTVTTALTLTVVIPPPVATSTTLSISPSGGRLNIGASYTLSATVTPASGSAAPTGNVLFTIGSMTQTVALNSSGVANYTGTAPSTAATLTLSAAYQGTAAFTPSVSSMINETIVVPTATTATVTFDVAAGTYSSPQSVALADVTPGAIIYYTTNGATPSTASSIYSVPIAVVSTETVKAIAVASGYTISAVASAAYVIQIPAATPVLSVPPGTYGTPQVMTITETTRNAGIYYTTDGGTPTSASKQYLQPFGFSTTETIKAIAYAPAFLPSAVASASYVFNLAPAATPTFTPAAGTYTSAQTVKINDATAGAAIYYTLDGTTPSTASAHYTAAIAVAATETIKAIAVVSGHPNSALGSAHYAIDYPAATPVFSPVPGTYTTPVLMTISDTTHDAGIYFTTDGTTPTSASRPYVQPFGFSTSETIKAIAIAPGFSSSTIASGAYIINLPPAATPTFTPAAGTYTSAQTVKIADATAGATVYYTTDGTAPTTFSTKYTAAVSVSATSTIRAIAVAPSHSTSAVGSAHYAIDYPAAAPVISPAPGTYTTQQVVTITDTTHDAGIYITTDGSTPTASSRPYVQPFGISASETVKAVAIASGFSISPVTTSTYVLNLPATATPAFSPVAGTYMGTQSVRITDATAGAVMYYTTDGSTPTTSSTKYTGAISVTATETINVIAVASVHSNSAVASAMFTID